MSLLLSDSSKKGAEIEAADDWDFGPIHTAAATGTEDIVELFHQNDADLHEKGEDGSFAVSMRRRITP